METKATAKVMSTKFLFSEESPDCKPSIMCHAVPKRKEIALSFVLFTTFLVITLLIYVVYDGFWDLSSTKKQVLFSITTGSMYTSLFCLCWSLFGVVIQIAARYFMRSTDRSTFIGYSLLHNAKKLKLCCSLVTLAMVVIHILDSRGGELVTDEDDDGKAAADGDTTPKPKTGAEKVSSPDDPPTSPPVKRRFLFDHTFFEVKEVTAMKYILGISLLALMFTIKEFILQYINYNMHYKFFEKRIADLNNNTKMLQKLNALIDIDTEQVELGELASLAYDALAGRSDELYKERFVFYFGEVEGSRLFSLFDIDADHVINKEEFIECYCGIFNQKYELFNSLTGNDRSIEKLDMILFIITLLIGIFVLFMSIGESKKASTILSYVGGIFFPLSFIFGGFLADMFRSLIFVFGIRPFDVGDRISLSNKVYEVVELGLLYSTLKAENKVYVFPNNTLSNQPTVNYRHSEYVIMPINQSYRTDSFEGKLEELRERIAQFIECNRKYYKTDFNVSMIDIEGSFTKLIINLGIKCNYQFLNKLYERRDAFILFLDKTLKEMSVSR